MLDELCDALVALLVKPLWTFYGLLRYEVSPSMGATRPVRHIYHRRGRGGVTWAYSDEVDRGFRPDLERAERPTSGAQNLRNAYSEI